MTAVVGLLPVLVLLGGALVFALATPLPLRIRKLIPLIVCALAAVGVIVSARAATDPVTLIAPSDVLPALSLTVQWNGAALPLSLFVLVILVGRMVMGLESDPRSFSAGTLVTASGALLWFAADNWTMITAAWLLVEFGLLIIPVEALDQRDAPARAFGWNLAGMVAWLAAGMILANAGSSLRLEDATLTDSAALLMLLAIWIRSGLYPFQAAAPATGESLGIRLGLPLLLGGYLMTRMVTEIPTPIEWAAPAQIVALAAIGISALVVVGQPHGSESFVWLLRAFGAPLLVLPFLISAPLAPALALGLGLGAFAAANLISVALMWRAELPRLRMTMLLWVAVLISVAMLPLSPAFWSRTGLLAGAYAEGRLPFWLILVGTLSLTLIPVWREIFASREVAPRVPEWTDYAALGCLILPALIVGLAPAVVDNAMGQAVSNSAAVASAAIFQPRDFATLIFTMAGLGIPLLASFELARRWDRRANLVPVRVTEILDLTGLAWVLDRVYRFVRMLVQQSMSILEQPPIAWLIFLAIWMAVWLKGL